MGVYAKNCGKQSVVSGSPWIPLLSAIGWKSLKFKKWIFRKYQKCMRAKNFKTMIFHKYQKMYADLNSWTMISHSLKIFLIHQDLRMILHFVKISGLLRFSQTYYGQCLSTMIKYTNLFLGGPRHKNNKKRCLVGPNQTKFRSPRKLR